MTVEGGEPVKVLLPEVGAEEQVIGKDRWEFIHKLKAAGKSVSQIARITDTDRKTVRGCLARSHWHPYRRERRGNTLLGPYAAWLEQRAAQVGYSARILLQELCRDGYSESGNAAARTQRSPSRKVRSDAVPSQTDISVNSYLATHVLNH
jgi:hypothetical protein